MIQHVLSWHQNTLKDAISIEPSSRTENPPITHRTPILNPPFKQLSALEPKEVLTEKGDEGRI